MPRRRIGVDDRSRYQNGSLTKRLADEIRSSRESGQPIINEQQFPTGKLRVTVVWDDWEHLPFEARTAVILGAYDIAEVQGYRERIALASGLTVPEAYAASMLPYQVFAALRKGDPVKPEQCHKAMIEEGGSTLFGEGTVQLRFATEEEAENARRRLAERLPNSEQVWVIIKDVGKMDEWAEA